MHWSILTMKYILHIRLPFASLYNLCPLKLFHEESRVMSAVYFYMMSPTQYSSVQQI